MVIRSILSFSKITAMAFQMHDFDFLRMLGYVIVSFLASSLRQEEDQMA